VHSMGEASIFGLGSSLLRSAGAAEHGTALSSSLDMLSEVNAIPRKGLDLSVHDVGGDSNLGLRFSYKDATGAGFSQNGGGMTFNGASTGFVGPSEGIGIGGLPGGGLRSGAGAAGKRPTEQLSLQLKF
jgi:hypothetical protein